MKGFRQVMISEKDIALIKKIAGLIEEKDGERPKNAAVIRKALNYYDRHKFKNK